ncbi:NADH:ubiquinone oxidoreductase subunit K [Bacillus aryabhattai]|uniref:NADH:ubiquinone oxidoreductase subunit K n=1 Tax=Priestia aryabhattai TaxID=412384 RepID=A0A7W3NI03_PRIAR|nr:hypothetical protein [Priestia aryabhattai]MBA9043242.1 NADH:ubiquinone oxidoreductase subunit K [Priestia aryabhattai]
MRLNFYSILFIILAIASNLIAIYAFHQAILGYVLTILFLIIAAYCTKSKKPNKQKDI